MNGRTPKLCESRGGRPGLPTVSEDVKQHWKTKKAVSARKVVGSVAAGCGRWSRTERLVLDALFDLGGFC